MVVQVLYKGYNVTETKKPHSSVVKNDIRTTVGRQKQIQVQKQVISADTQIKSEEQPKSIFKDTKLGNIAQASLRPAQPKTTSKGIGLSYASGTGGTAMGTFLIAPHVKTRVYSDIKRGYLTLSEVQAEQFKQAKPIEKLLWVGTGIATSPIIFGGIHPKTAQVSTVIKQTSDKTSRSVSLVEIGEKQVYVKGKAIHGTRQPTTITATQIIPEHYPSIYQSDVYTSAKALKAGEPIKYLGGERTFLGGERALVGGKEVQLVTTKGTISQLPKGSPQYASESVGTLVDNKLYVGESLLRGQSGFIKGTAMQKAIILKEGQTLNIPTVFKASSGKSITTALKSVLQSQSAQAGAIGAKLSSADTLKSIALTLPLGLSNIKTATKTKTTQLITPKQLETPIQIPITTTIPITEEKVIPRAITTSIPPSSIPKTTIIPTTIPIIEPIIPTTPRTTTRTIPSTIPTTIPINVPIRNPPYIIPPIPFDLPNFMFKPKFDKGLKIKPRKEYTPSLSAILSGKTTTKIPKLITGLGMRPIYVKRKRKRKKR